MTRVFVTGGGLGTPVPPFSALLGGLSRFAESGGIAEEIVTQGDPRDPALIHAVFASPRPSKGRAVLLFLHGKGGSAGEWIHDVKVALRMGFSVIVPNLRGHAPSTGEHITYGVLETGDIERLVEALHRRFGFDQERVGVDACSLGTLTGIRFSTVFPVRALWLQAPFCRLQDLAVHYLAAATGLPVRLLTLPAVAAVSRIETLTGFTLESIDPLAHARNVRCPVTVVHGDADERVPLRFGRPVFDALAGSKELWVVPRAGHCHHPSEPRTLARDEYVEKWGGFFRFHLQGRSGPLRLS